MERVLDEASGIFEDLSVSLTGGEPLLHPQFSELIDLFRRRNLTWRFVSNGWHMNRVIAKLREHPPEIVRLSLSGGSEAVHDEERGRGSFRRVLLATAMLTSERIPTSLSLLIDRRSRHQIAETAALAESLGAVSLRFILPQPTPTSVERSSDIDPREWMDVRREVEEQAAIAGRRTAIQLEYGVPVDGPEEMCNFMGIRRMYVDAHGRLSTCCQMSDYGGNDADVVADLNTTSLTDALAPYMRRMEQQIAATRVHSTAPTAPGLAPFPCMRCAQATGKLAWLANYPDSDWFGLARSGLLTPIVNISPVRARAAVPAAL
jgi:sulfatase maturation enzyme AslB (radical SAM superfamily)